MDSIEELINEIQDILIEIMTSGFSRVHDSSLNELKRFAVLCESYGLDYGAEGIKNLYVMLDNKRHIFDFDYSKVTDEFFIINRYFMICKKQLEYEAVKEKF